MAVKFTALIKMDMDRDIKKDCVQEGWGCIEEDISIWHYHIEVPCKADVNENARLVNALDKKFKQEEDGHTVVIKNGNIYFKVHSSWSDCHTTIEELYESVQIYTEYLEEVLEEYDVHECILTLELESDVSFYMYD